MSNSGLLPHVPAFRPDQEAIDAMTSCVVTTHADMNIIEFRPLPLASISPNSGSSAALAKMEHHRADQEDDQAAIPEKHPDALRFAVFAAVLFFFGCAPRPLVVDLMGADDEQREDGRERADRHEEKDAAIRNEATKQAHRYRRDDVAGRVESLVASLAAIK